jgi:YggT family protein
MFLQTFLGILLMLLWMMVLGRVLVSWVDPQGRSPVASFLVQATEPLLAPVRKFMPQTGMFDFSALIVLLILGALMRAFLR